MVGFGRFVKDKNYLERFSKYSKVAGVLFLILGAIGIAYPAVLSITTAYFVAWLLILSGFTIGTHTLKTNKRDWLGWFKSFMFILSGIFTILNPGAGVAALGIILATYFFMDGFVNFALAIEQRGQAGWWLILINLLISIVLGFVFISGWPFSSIFYVGLYVGISLIFDGIVLLSMATAVKKIEEDIK